jgi:flagellar FliL protein
MSNAAVAAEAPPAPKGKKKLIVIAVAAAVLLLGGGGTAALMLMKKKPVDEDGEETAQVEQAKPKPKAATPTRDPKAVPVFAQLDPFTVNLADREVERYAQVALTLELDDAKTEAQVKNYMPAIRNNILMVLAHKTSAQILGADGKTRLAGEIQRATARALGYEVEEPEADEAVADDEAKPKKKKKKKAADVTLPVVAVHFSNFIVQ